jgi:hypothetical protein
MITSVQRVEAGGPALRFWRQQGRLITGAISYVRYMSRSAEELRIRLGVDAGELDALETEIAQRTQAAERAYEKRESREATWVVVPLSQAHVIHTALVVSTELTGSEEEYTIKVGFFKENALALAEGMISAVRPEEDAPQGLP